MSIVNTTLAEHIQLAQSIMSLEADILEAGKICRQALDKGHKILLAGNGGSASDAQHIATEIVGRFEKDRPGLAAMALTTNGSSLTAIANDFGFEKVFSRQVEGLGAPGDVFIGLSTSGRSENVLKACKKAKKMGMTVIALTGENDVRFKSRSDLSIAVPHHRTARIQEMHILIGHILCSIIDE